MELITVILGGGISAALVSGAVQVVMWRLNRSAQKEDKTDDIRVALRIILQDRIRYLCKKYIEADEVDYDDYKDLKAMHEIYQEKLNGNGVFDALIAKVDALRVV
jgi:hypothetical protein